MSGLAELRSVRLSVAAARTLYLPAAAALVQRYKPAACLTSLAALSPERMSKVAACSISSPAGSASRGQWAAPSWWKSAVPRAAHVRSWRRRANRGCGYHGSVLTGGALQNVIALGAAVDTTVLGSSYLFVNALGTASGTVVSSGGVEQVTFDGLDIGARIDGGGGRYVYGSAVRTTLRLRHLGIVDQRQRRRGRWLCAAGVRRPRRRADCRLRR